MKYEIRKYISWFQLGTILRFKTKEINPWIGYIGHRFGWDAKQGTVKQSIDLQKQKVLRLLSWKDKRKNQCYHSPEASHWGKLALLYAWLATAEDKAVLEMQLGIERKGQIPWLFSSPSNFLPVPPITWTGKKPADPGAWEMQPAGIGACHMEQFKGRI